MHSSGYISEVFSSIQGEGIYAGVRQIFVRTSGCSLSCIYCDSESSRGRTRYCRLVEDETTLEIENPVDIDTLFSFVKKLKGNLKGLHSMSITGGEPLEQADFLEPFLKRLREEDCTIYLETNGLIEEGARMLAPLSDIVSLDIKLPSLCGGGNLFEIYESTIPLFLEKELFFKIVVMDGLSRSEFEEAVRLLQKFAIESTLVIQPAMKDRVHLAIDLHELLDCYDIASSYIKDVRIIPQIHGIIGVE